MAMNRAVTLPQEMILEIILRLPTKCIGKFRCVSKQWNSLLSDPKFIKSHLSEQKDDKLILSSNGSLYTISITQNKDLTTTKLNFPLLKDKYWDRIVATCNGLVLAISRDGIRYLINPTTLKHHKIPNCPFPFPPDLCKDWKYGFAYDVLSDDYKVAALSYFDRFAHCEPENGYPDDCYVDVYSVRMGLWRRLDDSPYDHSGCRSLNGVLINGALHWMVSRKDCVIVAFDLSDEKFSYMPTPDIEGDFFYFHLMVLRGCLCLFTYLKMTKIQFWMMREYGVQEFWTMVELNDPIFVSDSWLLPLCSMNDDTVVMDGEEGWVVYNVMEKDYMILTEGVPRYVRDTRSFVDSLVSPSYGQGNVGLCIARCLRWCK